MRRTASAFFIALAVAAGILRGCSGPEGAGKGEKRAVADTGAERAEGERAGAGDGTLVVMGASYAQAWNVREIAGMRVVNKGVGGETSFEMLGRFPEDVIALRPKTVILWGFVNDVHRAGRDEMDAALERVRESIRGMVRLARENGIEPILATEVTIRRRDGWRSAAAWCWGRVRGKESYQSYVNRQVRETNRWIRQVAGEHRIPLLDFQPILADRKGFRKKRFATPDGTHLSEAAYAELTAHAQEVLGGFFAGRAPGPNSATPPPEREPVHE